MKDAKEYCPTNKSDWRKWLALHHEEEQAVWLIFYKKKSPLYNLSWSDAVDEALCFGWIDSTKKTIDQEKYKQYFCKRKPKSTWSKVNKDKVDSLIKQGLMQDAGYKSIALAKENGSWSILDDVEALIIPADLEAALAKYQGAKQFFEHLNKSSKKGLLYWVISAKRPATRQKRIADIAENAGNELLPKPFR